MIGSLPHTDPNKACSLVARYLSKAPAWPQLPKRSFLEEMIVQYSEGMPGLVINTNSLSIRHDESFEYSVEKLYSSYINNEYSSYPISVRHAAGLHEFMNTFNQSCVATKGQIVGPLTFGLMLKDDQGQSILHDEFMIDLCARLLRLKASWQENELRKLGKKTIMFIDEPVMASYGSAYFTVSKEKILKMLGEVIGGISGICGIHCCGNTDWSILLNTNIHIISFDAYNYASSLEFFPSEVKAFLDRGGAIAWGIVPNTPETLQKENISSLKDRLEEAMAPFIRHGIKHKQLKEQCLITPCCGLSGLSETAAESALALLLQLSEAI